MIGWQWWWVRWSCWVVSFKFVVYIIFHFHTNEKAYLLVWNSLIVNFSYRLACNLQVEAEEVRHEWRHIHDHVVLISKLIANIPHSIVLTPISRHQKLLACWVLSGSGVFLAMLKLPIWSRLVTSVRVSLNSHMYAVWDNKTVQCSFDLARCLQHHTKPPKPVMILIVECF